MPPVLLAGDANISNHNDETTAGHEHAIDVLPHAIKLS